MSRSSRPEADLGEGTYSYVCKTTYNGKPAAVKIFKNATDISDATLEADVLRSLRHPHIIECIGYTRDPPKIYMPRMDGSLLDLLIEGINTPAIGWEVLRQMLEALIYLHDRGITHRDIKPANILYRKVGKRYTFSLADFGSCTWMSKSPFGIYGTKQFWAPEVTNRGLHTRAMDVWALFVTIMFFFDSGGIQKDWTPEIVQEHVMGVARANRGVTDFRDMVEYEPEARPTAQELYSRFWGSGDGSAAEKTPSSGGDIGGVFLEEAPLSPSLSYVDTGPVYRDEPSSPKSTDSHLFTPFEDDFGFLALDEEQGGSSPITPQSALYSSDEHRQIRILSR
ncbi:kinase-like protein [Thozetella sp. PMI_491]|nr:kinase-like protein [Thozetella sp. PMI_491]